MGERHEVHHQRDRGYTRWLCACGWATEWTAYTDPGAGASAVRHQIEANREE